MFDVLDIITVVNHVIGVNTLDEQCPSGSGRRRRRLDGQATAPLATLTYEVDGQDVYLRFQSTAPITGLQLELGCPLGQTGCSYGPSNAVPDTEGNSQAGTAVAAAGMDFTLGQPGYPALAFSFSGAAIPPPEVGQGESERLVKVLVGPGTAGVCVSSVVLGSSGDQPAFDVTVLDPPSAWACAAPVTSGAAQPPQALVHVQAGGNVVVGQNGVLTIGASAGGGAGSSSDGPA